MKKEKRTIKNKIVFIFGILFFIYIIGVISAQTTWPAYNVCCEKTIDGAWCQNTIESNCDKSIDSLTKYAFRTTPTSCDSTSFCKAGCCVDTQEGLCMENTPQRVCAQTTGTWMDSPKCDVPQCDLGCCILGDQASFVTLTRCKRMSAIYGLTTNFKKNIKDETSCILLAQLQDKGACVYEVDNERTCKFSTRAECLDTNKTRASNITSAPEFFKDYLCSSDELHTNCGPTTQTACIPGKDEVYFVDSCGNIANIYDAGKTYDKLPSYWQKIVAKADSCGYNGVKGNSGSKTCGNCDYFKGSICGTGSASFGDNVCKDLNCYATSNGNDYKNGESWCVDMDPATGQGRDLVGSRHFRHLCINGEEITEACSDYRNEICLQNKLTTFEGDFNEAACRPNRNKDCLDQTVKEDCLNTDKRDCFWLLGAKYQTASTADTTPSLDNSSTSTTTGKGVKIASGEGICLPNWPLGLKHWSDGDAKPMCSQGSVTETVTYEKGLIGGEKCTDNCDVLTDAWATKMNNVCTSLGDCGAYSNVQHKFTTQGSQWVIDGTKTVISGIMDNIKTKTGS